MKILLFAWSALFFALFEIAQLVVAQRYIGIEQIRRNQHPVDLAVPPPLKLSLVWLYTMLLSYLFQFSLLFLPISQLSGYTTNPYLVRTAALLMVMVGLVGFSLRRVCGLRLGLVVLTFEGAMRMGFMLFVFNVVVLHWNLYWLFRFFSHFRHPAT